MKNIFNIIVCFVVVLQLILLFEKDNDLIYYDAYLGLTKGSYGYPVPYHKIISVIFLIAFFVIGIVMVIIKKSKLFYHGLIAISAIYMFIIGYDLCLHRYSNPISFKWILFISLGLMILTLLISRFNNLKVRLNIFVLIINLVLAIAFLMSLLWFDIV